MILANGILRPDGDLPQVLAGLEDELLTTLARPVLEARTVIGACARLLDRLDRGEVLLNVHYTVRSTNNPNNLVFPYYLYEGVGDEL